VLLSISSGRRQCRSTPSEENLIAANLKGAKLSQTNLEGANLSGANLRGAVFEDPQGAARGLTWEQLSSAEHVHEAKLPASLRKAPGGDPPEAAPGAPESGYGNPT
jgi:hypothetical protein